MEDLIIYGVRKFDSTFSIKPKQLECFKYILDEKDLIVNLSVGYGKSLLYQALPSVYRVCKGSISAKHIVIIISPLNIIQKEQLGILAARNIPACRLPFGDSDYGSVNTTKIVDGYFDIIFAHPETLLNTNLGRDLLGSTDFVNKVIALFIDECHIIDSWGEEFRTAYSRLKTLPAVFGTTPVIALSGTLTLKNLSKLPSIIGLEKPEIIQESPDRPNIFLVKKPKLRSTDSHEIYSDIYKRECDLLKLHPTTYPVTLMFMPLYYISEAAAYLRYLFGNSNIYTSCYAILYSNQDKAVIQATIDDLHQETPTIRLVLTSSVAGMGFDPPSVSRIIHARPPRTICQYLQEIGRAGRRGQDATAILHYNRMDIGKNVPGIEHEIIEYCSHEDTCLRELLLQPFGFLKGDEITPEKCCSYCSDRHLTSSIL